MAVFKSVILLFAVVFAVAFATEEPKGKRHVIVGAIPTMDYATPIMHYASHPSIPYAAMLHARTIGIPAYDDGKYFPGKYEKPTFYTAFPHMIAV